MTKRKMLSEKRIKGLTPDELIETLHTVVKWLEVFAEAGEEIYGEEYPLVLAFIGLPLPSLVDAIEAVAHRGDEMVARMKAEKVNKNHPDLLKGFGIKLEGDETKPN